MRKNIKTKIYQILLKDERARNDDNYLYAKYLELENEELARKYMRIINEIKEYKFADRKSIERTRRKLQEWDRDRGVRIIQSDKQIKKWRKQKEQEYKEKYKKEKTYE